MTFDAPNKSTRHQDANNFSPKLLMYISSSKHGTVVSRAPESFTMQLASDWDTPLSGGSASGIIEIGAQNLLGISTKTQFASAQSWSGTSPVSITVSLEFQAEEDPRREVVQPIITLAKMALPRKSGFGGSMGLFVPPGPRIFDISSGTDNILIQIGNFMFFQKVIITDVTPEFFTRDMGITGQPLRAKCDLTFRTAFSLTGDEFAGMFFR